ncbi:MAG: ABC transporter permease [Nocardioides sp.]
MRLLRLFALSYWLHLKMLAVSVFDGIFQVVWPLYFATVAFLLYGRAADDSLLIYAGLGAAVMGIWSVVTTTASSLLQRERWLGTLELLVASPTRFAMILVPITTAMASLGLFSLVSTLVWARLLFGITVPVESPLAFVLAIVVSIFSVALLGFLLSVAVVRYRTAWAMGNLLEYPGWLLCGFLVPLTLFPGWVTWIAYALPPTWGMQAIRAAAAGESPWLDIAMCLVVGLAYGVVGSLMSETVLRSARRHATLSLT